jgi:Ca2+-binding RTX toxin-like protein
MSTRRSIPRSRCAALLAGLVALLVPLALTTSAGATVTASVTGTELAVASDASDPITVSCAGGNVKINGFDPVGGPAACASLTGIVVTGGPGANTVDLSSLTPDDLGAAREILVTGEAGDDTITGSQVAELVEGGEGDDRIVGARGNDVMLGGDGDDRIVWKDGDGTDRMEGLAGTDATEVNGANAAGDAFAISPDGQRVRFERTNLEPFGLDIGTTETLEMNGGGGDDTIAGTAGLAPLLKLRMNGGEGNDTLIGSDGDDVMDAGPGDDTMVCGAGHDVMAGNDGDDRMVWNHGDGSDVMDGQAGNDTAEVNGAPGDGDHFTVKPAESRLRFERVNLVPFRLDIATTERLLVRAGGGDDRIRGAQGLAGLVAGSFHGEGGNDTITGTAAEDLLSGGTGRDVISARDKVADSVKCDAGSDLARVDRRDRVRGCELVLGGRPRVRLAGKAIAVTGGVGVLRLRCVAARRCGGSVRLLRASKALGRARFDVPRRPTTVRVKLNRRGRRLLARAPHKGLQVKARIDAPDGAGNRWRTTARALLKASRQSANG